VGHLGSPAVRFVKKPGMCKLNGKYQVVPLLNVGLEMADVLLVHEWLS